MIININARHRIAGEAMQWSVQKLYVSEKSTTWKALAYFGDLAGALRFYVLSGIRSADVEVSDEQLEKLFAFMDEMKAEIERIGELVESGALARAGEPDAAH